MEQEEGAGRIELRGPMRRIGTATLEVAKTLRDDDYPTASWYRLVACEPQTVVLRSDGYWVIFAFEGPIEESYMPSTLMGVRTDNPQDAQDVGKPWRRGYQVYGYQLAEWLAGAQGLDDVTFTLDDEYGFAPNTISTQGQESWHLTMPSDGHPLEIKWLGSERDPAHYTSIWERYRVTYRGEDRGEVRVRSGQLSYDEAMRAAEALAFGGQETGR